MSCPGIFALLARHCLDQGIALPGLHSVRCFGEPVTGELRELVREAWNVPVVRRMPAPGQGVLAPNG